MLAIIKNNDSNYLELIRYFITKPYLPFVYSFPGADDLEQLKTDGAASAIWKPLSLLLTAVAVP